MQFEWDPNKGLRNLREHKVDFAWAKLVFEDIHAIVRYDTRFAYGEERLIMIGRVGADIVQVVYTERRESIRLISARRATRKETDDYFQQNS